MNRKTEPDATVPRSRRRTVSRATRPAARRTNDGRTDASTDGANGLPPHGPDDPPGCPVQVLGDAACRCRPDARDAGRTTGDPGTTPSHPGSPPAALHTTPLDAENESTPPDFHNRISTEQSRILSLAASGRAYHGDALAGLYGCVPRDPNERPARFTSSDPDVARARASYYRSLKRLESRGLIRRTLHDYTLTDAGRALLAGVVDADDAQ